MKCNCRVNYLGVEVMIMSDGAKIYAFTLWDPAANEPYKVFVSDNKTYAAMIDVLTVCKMGDELDCEFLFRRDRDNPNRFKLCLTSAVPA